MHYTEPVYRPLFERSALLLQVTQGCSHNKCAFCGMYKNVAFKPESLEQIEADLAEARAARPECRRVFLLSGDAFALDAECLASIAKLIYKHLPEVEVITSFASIKNIMAKSDGDLKQLRALNFNDLNIGLETALPTALAWCKKGCDVNQAREQLLRLKRAGFDFSLNIIVGIAGSALSMDNARADAEFLNIIQPQKICVSTTHVDGDTALTRELASGDFAENTLRENLLEELELIKNLRLTHTIFESRHVSNLVGAYGLLPDKQAQIIWLLEENLKRLPAERLDAIAKRGREGAVEI